MASNPRGKYQGLSDEPGGLRSALANPGAVADSKLDKLDGGVSIERDAEWFLKDGKGFPKEVRWNPVDLFLDIPRGLFADMLYNSHKSAIFGALVFMFSVACVLLWIVGEGFWATSDPTEYEMEYDLPPPEEVVTNVKFSMTIRVLNAGDSSGVSVGVPGVAVRLAAYPAERFNLPIEYYNSRKQTVQIAPREVDCWEYLYGEPTYWSYQDKILCDVQLSQVEAITDDDGYATFEDLRVTGGADALLTVVATADLPEAELPLYLRQFVRHVSPIYLWLPITPFTGGAGGGGSRGEEEVTFLFVAYQEALLSEEEWKEYASGFTFSAVTAVVDGKNLMTPEFMPMRVPDTKQFADLEITSVEHLPDHSEATYDLQEWGTGGVIVYKATIRTRWFIGLAFYPCLFMGSGLMYLGDGSANAGYTHPHHLQQIVLNSRDPGEPAPSVTMRTELPAEVIEGQVFEVVFDITPAPGIPFDPDTSLSIAVAAGLITYNGAAMPDYWLDPPRTPTASTFKKLSNALAVAEENDDGTWSITLRPRFTTAGRIGEYGVGFLWEMNPVVPRGAKIDGAVWYVEVVSAVYDVNTAFETSLDGLKALGELQADPVGKPVAGTPSFLVLDYNGLPLAGKTVRTEISEPTGCGLSFQSLESDAQGLVSLADMQFTFASRDGDVNIKAFVDDLLALDVVVPVTLTNVSRSRPSHIHVLVDPDALPWRHEFQPTVRVRVVNGYNEPLAGVPVWARIGWRDRAMPPCGFAPADDPGAPGARESAKIRTDANGYADIPMTHVGGPCLAPITFSAEGIHEDAIFPAWGQGGYLMFWDTRSEAGIEGVFIPETRITQRPGPNPGEIIVEGTNDVIPVQLRIVKLPARLMTVFEDMPPALSAPPSGTSRNPSLTLSGVDAPGTYVIAAFADGKWGAGFSGGDIVEVMVETPVAGVMLITESEVDMGSGLPEGVMHSDGTPFGVQPEVLVTDAAGNPVEGARVSAVLHFEDVSPANPETSALYFPEALEVLGAVMEMSGFATTSFDEVANMTSRIRLPWAREMATSPLMTANDLLKAVASSTFDSTTLAALEALSTFELQLPVSAPSGPDGVASFSYLGVLNPPTDRKVRLSYVYVHGGEAMSVSGDAIFATESVGRVGNQKYRARMFVPPQPFATPSAPLTSPPSVVMYDEKNGILPFLVGVVVAVPAVDGRNLYARTSVDGILQRGTGVMVVGGLQFQKDSDLGSYNLEFRLPGATVMTSAIDVVRSPHRLEILNVDSIPVATVSGSSIVAEVAAVLADGSRVAGAPIKANVRIIDETGKKVCPECELPKFQGVTNEEGLYVFIISLGDALTARYVLEFTSDRGLSDYAAAEFALSQAQEKSTEATRMLSGLMDTDSAFQPFLDTVIDQGAGYVRKFLFDNALTAKVTTITTDSPPVLIFNGVTSVLPVVEPVKLAQTPITGNDGRTFYNVTLSNATLRLTNLAGEPLPRFFLTAVIVEREGDKEFNLDPDYVGWDRSQESNNTGHLVVGGLWMVLPAGKYIPKFAVQGNFNATPAFEVVKDITTEQVASVYERAAVIVALLLPWLFANVPYSSVYWVFLSFALAALLPFWVYSLLPGIFESDVLFIKLSMWFTAAMWGVIVLAFLYETLKLCRGGLPEMTVRINNDYRYVRWLAQLIPFSNARDVECARFQAAVARQGPLRGLVLKYYLWRTRGQWTGPGGLPIALPSVKGQEGRQTAAKPSWVSTTGITLHRDPKAYRQCDLAIKHRYGVFRGSVAETHADVTVRVHGAYAEHLSKHLGALAADISAKLGAAATGVRVAPTEIGGPYARVIFTVVDDPSGATREAVHGKGFVGRCLDQTTAAVSRSTAAKVVVDAVVMYTPAVLRRDNDSEWTFWDSWKVRMHFYAVPLIVEEERAIEECSDDVWERTDGVKPVGRVWVRHRLPEGMVRSNGRPFPDFWSPSYSAAGDAALCENDPNSMWFVPLDKVTPEAGGRPEDIEDPVRVPFRFLVSAGICFVFVAFIAFYAFYYTEKLRDSVRRVSASVPDPDKYGVNTPAEETRMNELIRLQFVYALNVVASANPSFLAVKKWESRVNKVDFMKEWRRLYRVSHNTLDSVSAAATMAAIVTPILAFASWFFLVKATPVYYRDLRRNKPAEANVRTSTSCSKADLYVGLQALGGAINYVLLFVVIFLVGLVVFNASILPVAWTFLQSAVIAALVASVVKTLINLSVALIWAPGLRVEWPRVYTKVMLATSIIGLVGGAVQTIVRLVKSIVAQLLLFPRLDVRSIPATFGKLDAGYWSYWSMLYVDELHNNPILRVFTGVVLTDYLITAVNKEVIPGGGVRSVDEANAGAAHALVRIVPHRTHGGGAKCTIGDVNVYVDRELVSANGHPLRYIPREAGGAGGKKDMRYFRAPAALGEAVPHEGCCRCGAPPEHLPEYYVVDEDAVGHLRVVVAPAAAPPAMMNGDHGETGAPHAPADSAPPTWREHRARIKVDGIPPQHHGHAESDGGGYVTSLPQSMRVGRFYVETVATATGPGGVGDGVVLLDGNDTRELAAGLAHPHQQHLLAHARYMVLGSAGASSGCGLWRVLYEGRLAGDGSFPHHMVAPNVRSEFAVCTRCHASRRPAEGEPRVLVAADSRFVRGTSCDGGGVTAGVGESFYTEVLLPSPDSRVRAYAIRTSQASPEMDPVSWVVAVAYTSYEAHTLAPEDTRWHVHHEVLDAPMPPARRMYTARFGVWPAPASRLDVRKEVWALCRHKFPFLRELVRVRLKHVLGMRGEQLASREADREPMAVAHTPTAEAAGARESLPSGKGSSPSDVEMSAIGADHHGPTRANGAYTSLLERSAFRNARCRHNQWMLGFVLTMNPSLIGERKAFKGRDVSLDEMKGNAAGMRRQINRQKWRHTELVSGQPQGYANGNADAFSGLTVLDHSSEEGGAGSGVGATPMSGGEYLRLTCDGAPMFNGDYVKATQHRSLRVRIDGGLTELVVQEEVRGVVAARIGGVDLTPTFAALQQERQGTGLWVGLVDRRHGPATPRRNFQTVDITSAVTGVDVPVFEIYYTGVVYERREASEHIMRGVTTTHVAKAPMTLRYFDCAWHVGVAAPAPGYSYSCLVSNPTQTTTDPGAAGLVWHRWDARAWQWVSHVGVRMMKGPAATQVQQGSLTAPAGLRAGTHLAMSPQHGARPSGSQDRAWQPNQAPHAHALPAHSATYYPRQASPQRHPTFNSDVDAPILGGAGSGMLIRSHSRADAAHAGFNGMQPPVRRAHTRSPDQRPLATDNYVTI